nr:hypothetical protein [Deltaproteobacteria bacterium]
MKPPDTTLRVIGATVGWDVIGSRAGAPAKRPASVTNTNWSPHSARTSPVRKL